MDIFFFFCALKRHLSKTVGLITQTTTRLVIMRAAEIKVTRKMLPLLAGNLPRMIQYYGNVSEFGAFSIDQKFDSFLFCFCVKKGGSNKKAQRGLLSSHTWLSKYLRPPTMRISIDIPRKVAPSGFPNCRSLVVPVGCGLRPSRSEIVAFRRKSWVMAMPIEAKAKEVRSQARKVRSDLGCELLVIRKDRKAVR